MNISGGMSRQALIVKKNSPHIFFAAGLGGAIVSAVLACRATLKLEETLEEIQNDVKQVTDLKKDPAPESAYPEGEYVKDLSYVYVKSAKKLVILYGPAVILGTASIAALSGSHIQMTRRNAALTATLAAVSKAYDEYRIRVQDELGKEKELAIYRDVKKEANDDQKALGQGGDTVSWSPYARIFDASNPNWERHYKEGSLNFIQTQQNYWNHKLQARGHVFLNEVYNSLGLEHSQPGCVVGWVLNGDGDNYIDFGLADAYISNRDDQIELDFNVDGIVYDKI